MDEMPANGFNKNLIAPYLSPLPPIPTDFQYKGALKPPIRCLLCDIYGTLLISASGDIGQDQLQLSRYERLLPLLERYAITRSPEEIVNALHEAIKKEHTKSKQSGIDYPEVRIEVIWQQLLPSNNHQQILEFALEFEMVFNPVWPMPYLSELLSACRERNIWLGIISNAQFFTPYLLEWLAGDTLQQLGFRPDLSFFSYLHGIAKPSDRLFQMAAEQLKKEGIEPQRTAYIGNDMRKDILPAQQQAFQTILFAGDARSLRGNAEKEETEAPQPDLIVTELNQVISSLQPDKRVSSKQERMPQHDLHRKA